MSLILLTASLTRVTQVTSGQGEAGLGQAAVTQCKLYCSLYTLYALPCSVSCTAYSARAGLAARYKHTSGVLASHWSVNTGFSRLIGQNSGDLNAWDNIHICICLVSTVNYHLMHLYVSIFHLNYSTHH